MSALWSAEAQREAAAFIRLVHEWDALSSEQKQAERAKGAGSRFHLVPGTPELDLPGFEVAK